MDKKKVKEELKIIDSLDGKKKRSFKVNFIAWLFTALIILMLGTPFMIIGFLIHMFLW